jgi:hypothetical protein
MVTRQLSFPANEDIRKRFIEKEEYDRNQREIKSDKTLTHPSMLRIFFA